MGTLALLVLIQLAGPQPLEAIDNQELEFVLSSFVILADSKDLKHDPMWVRVLRVHEDGECGEQPETCPRSRLYIAVSEYGESPERKVYRLPWRYNWEFSAWKTIPDYDTPESFMVLELVYSTPSGSAESGWWNRHTVLAKVNSRGGFLADDREGG